MIEAYKRWRHTRGYGVHSPTAYTLVREVISQPYQFYGYAEIEAALAGHKHAARLERFCRLVLRLCNHLHPRTVFCSKTAPEAVRTAIRCAVPDAVISADPSTPADLYIDTARILSPARIRRLLEADGIALLLLAIDDEADSIIRRNLLHGLLLRSARHALVLTRSSMPFVSYSVNF